MDRYRFERLKTEYEVEVVYAPFELRPDLPEGGISSADHGLEPSEKVREYLLRHAKELGIPLQFPDLMPNTHRAMLMAEMGRDEDRYGDVQDALFRAYWGDGEDIGDESVLLRVALEVGLDPAQVVESWTSGRHEHRLHEFHHLALDMGVDSTPSALICNELMIGTRPYGVIRDAVERCLLTSTTAQDPEAVES